MVVYCATCKVNGKQYIGITSQPFGKRKASHLRDADMSKHNGMIFHSAIRKYGKENFDWCILETCNTKEELRQREVFHIRYKNTFSPNGYNMTIGGEMSDVTEELRDRYKAVSTNRKHTAETKNKCRLSKLGEMNPMSKKVICVETGVIYPSQSDAARSSGVSQALIWMVVNKKNGYHTAGGFHWEKVE